MIRSRLRRPTSKSMTATFLPRLASPTASEALEVVLPTPPLPEVTTMISVNGVSSGFVNHSFFNISLSPSSQACTRWPRRSFGMSSNTRYWPAIDTSSAWNSWQ